MSDELRAHQVSGASRVRTPLVVGTIPILTALSVRIYSLPVLTHAEKQRKIVYKLVKRPGQNARNVSNWRSCICGGSFADKYGSNCKMRLLSSPKTCEVKRCEVCSSTEDCYDCFWTRAIFDPVFVPRPHRFLLDRWVLRTHPCERACFENALNGGCAVPFQILLY